MIRDCILSTMTTDCTLVISMTEGSKPIPGEGDGECKPLNSDSYQSRFEKLIYTKHWRKMLCNSYISTFNDKSNNIVWKSVDEYIWCHVESDKLRYTSDKSKDRLLQSCLESLRSKKNDTIKSYLFLVCSKCTNQVKQYAEEGMRCKYSKSFLLDILLSTKRCKIIHRHRPYEANILMKIRDEIILSKIDTEHALENNTGHILENENIYDEAYDYNDRGIRLATGSCIDKYTNKKKNFVHLYNEEYMISYDIIYEDNTKYIIISGDLLSVYIMWIENNKCNLDNIIKGTKDYVESIFISYNNILRFDLSNSNNIPTYSSIEEYKERISYICDTLKINYYNFFRYLTVHEFIYTFKTKYNKGL